MLPPRPSFLPARPEGALAPAEPPASLIPLQDPSAQAGPSSSGSNTNTACLICAQPAKYTCPRCSARTCSAPCSKSHKVQLDCDGKRDPTKFVTLNTFSQGDWGGDYAYLESGRRRVAEWGKELPPSQAQAQSSHHARGPGRRGKGSPKVEGLRRELERRGIDVEFMPEGMGRRKLNQSSWNPKTQSLHLTIQLLVPSNLLDPLSIPTPEPKITTHLRVLLASPTQNAPSLASLLPEPLRQQHAGMIMVLPFHPSLANPTPIDILLRKPRPKLFFPPLAADRPISEDVFKGMSWVEFPVIHVWSQEDWRAAHEAGEVAVVPSSLGGGQKRKMDAGTGDGAATKQSPDSHEGDKRAKVVPSENGLGAGLLALTGYESEEDEEVEDVVDAADDDAVTEADLRVLHALGAAAAADME